MSGQGITKSVSTDGATATVSLSGVVNIETAAELQRVLQEAFSEAPLVQLDAQRLEDVDISILQIICSACKTAAASQRRFMLEGVPPACVKTFNGGIGAHMELPCRQNNNESCLLFGGTR